MSDVFERKEIQLDKRTKAVVKWMYDFDPDLSWLGEFTDKQTEYVVDRVDGVFLGKYVEGEFEIDVPDARADGDGLTLTDWEKVFKAIDVKLAEMKIKVNSDNLYVDSVEDYEQRPTMYLVSYSGMEIIADDLGRTCYDSSRSYRYFSPGPNHVPHDPKSWDHVSDDGKQRMIDQYGSLEKTDIAYALQDWKRMEDYLKDWWFMSGCAAEIYVDGTEVGSSYGLWGIESDSDDSYKWEIEEEQIYSALDDAQSQADSHAKIARKLKRLSPDKLTEGLKEMLQNA